VRANAPTAAAARPARPLPRAGVLALVVGLLVGGLVSVGPQEGRGQSVTPWFSPTQQLGLFQNPTGAFADGGGRARFGGFRFLHFYGGYGIVLPPGAQVVGIEVRLDAWDRRQPGGALAVELSWDGGLNWTSTGYTTGALPPQETTRVLGGPTDLWGRTAWTAADLSDPNFVVRLLVQGSNVRGRLDWVPVRVYYVLPGQGLSVSPATINGGTLGAAEYDLGYAEISPAQTITVDSGGTDWVLYIQAGGATWSYSGPYPDPGKPAGDLLWRITTSDGRVTARQGAYTALSTAPAQAARGTPGVGIALTAHVRVLLSYDRDPPGDYSLGIVYTLTTP